MSFLNTHAIGWPEVKGWFTLIQQRQQTPINTNNVWPTLTNYNKHHQLQRTPTNFNSTRLLDECEVALTWLKQNSWVLFEAFFRMSVYELPTYSSIWTLN